MTVRRKQAFTPEKVALPECRGCDLCGDAQDDHLYLLGYNGKYYCKVCFFKIAVKWPRSSGASSVWRTEVLSDDDMQWTLRVARLRNERAVESGKKNVSRVIGGIDSKDMSSDQDLLIHWQGCQGELAAARVYGVEWPAHVDTYKKLPDLPPCATLPNGGEVRAVSKSSYHLPFRPGDNPEYDYIAVVGTAGNPTMVVAGHKRGHQCKVGTPGYVGNINRGQKSWWVKLTDLDAPPRGLHGKEEVRKGASGDRVQG
jgi:hypothetical protein